MPAGECGESSLWTPLMTFQYSFLRILKGSKIDTNYNFNNLYLKNSENAKGIKEETFQYPNFRKTLSYVLCFFYGSDQSKTFYPSLESRQCNLIQQVMDFIHCNSISLFYLFPFYYSLFPPPPLQVIATTSCIGMWIPRSTMFTDFTAAV